MKTKRVLPLLAMLTAGSMLCLSGCDLDVTTVNEEEVSIEEEIEEEDLTEGTVLFHSVWYDEEGNTLPDVEVAFFEDEELAFSGTTDEDGVLEDFSLPCNTTLVCSVTDEEGNPIAESDVVIKLSDNYESLTIYPTRDAETELETPTLTLEVPTDTVNLRAGFYVTQSETVSLASVSPYEEEEETEEAAEEETEEAAEEKTEETAEEKSDEEQPAEDNADAEQPAEDNANEEQPAEDNADAEQPAEDNADAEQPAEDNANEEQPAEDNANEEQPAEN